MNATEQKTMEKESKGVKKKEKKVVKNDCRNETKENGQIWEKTKILRQRLPKTE